jgi:hypothetical protein
MFYFFLLILSYVAAADWLASLEGVLQKCNKSCTVVCALHFYMSVEFGGIYNREKDVVAFPLKVRSRSLWHFLNASQRCGIAQIIKNSSKILSYRHDNGNVLNRTSMDIDLLNTNLLDKI